MNTQMLPLAMLIGMCLGMASQAKGQSLTPYKDLLPDTLLPGKQYALVYNYALGDTIDLKGSGTTIRLVADKSSTLGWVYKFTPQTNSGAGYYSAYSPKGIRLESNVTFIPNMYALIPRIIKTISWDYGFRGYSYSIQIESMGLAFGPLQDTGAFIPNLRSASLELSGSKIPLSIRSGGNPYLQVFDFLVPQTVDTGSYRLVLERMDGIQTGKDSVFRIREPRPLPKIEKVTPDSLTLGVGGSISISGINMDFGILQGSGTVPLDRKIVKDVQLRRGNQVLSAYDFPNLGPISNPLTNTINATFYPPVDFIPGIFDLAVILHGSADTAFLRDAVRVVPRPELKLLSSSPAEVGKLLTFVLSINAENIWEDISGLEFFLSHGTQVLFGVLASTDPKPLQVRFEPQGKFDTGAYDLNVRVKSKKTYILENALRIVPPTIGNLSPMVFAAGRDDSMKIEMLYRDYDNQIITNVAGQVSPTITPNILQVNLCKSTNCFYGNNFRHDNNSMYTYAWDPALLVDFFPPIIQSPGVYDLAVTIQDPILTLIKKSAIVIPSPGFQAWLPEAIKGVPTTHWSISAGTLSALTIPSSNRCPGTTYKLLNAPTGMGINNGTLIWNPTKEDTGWHNILLATSESCTEHLFLAVHVDNDASASLKYSDRVHEMTSNSRLEAVNSNGFRINLSRPATLKLLSLEGKILENYEFLGMGIHSLSFPKSISSRNILLCRIQENNFVEWIRIIRTQ